LPTSLLQSRLLANGPLTDEAQEWLAAIPRRGFSARRYATLAAVGDHPSYAILLETGYALGHVVNRRGDRCVSAVYLPGDFIPLTLDTGAPLDHTVEALTDVHAYRVEHGALNDAASRHPSICIALRALQFQETQQLRALLQSVARESSDVRVGKLFLSLWSRGIKAGLVQSDSMLLPLTQTDLGDLLGITPVHLNRMLQRLREQGALSFRNGVLSISDPDELARSISQLPSPQRDDLDPAATAAPLMPLEVR
jgi:CRP-like cAMP-binding protein